MLCTPWEILPIWYISLFSRFIDSLNLLRGFFIFVTFVCKSSVIRKIRRALWPNQHLTVAWDEGIFKCHQKVNWVALQIVLVRCDNKHNKLLFYKDQKWTLTDIWSFSNEKIFQCVIRVSMGFCCKSEGRGEFV